MQEIGSFWPQEAGSWAALISAVLLVVATIAGFIYRTGRLQEKYESSLAAQRVSTTEKFKDQGQRIGEVETVCSSIKGILQEMRTVDQAHTYQIDTNSREAGRLAGELREVSDLLDGCLQQRREFETEMRERLARLEERVKSILTRGGSNART